MGVSQSPYINGSVVLHFSEISAWHWDGFKKIKPATGDMDE